MRHLMNHNLTRLIFRAIPVICISFVILLSGCQPDNTGSSISVSSSPPGTTTSITIPSPTVTIDLDKDGIDDEIEDRLIKRFAPVVRFHVNEQYLPINVDWFLPRVRMRFDVNLGFDKQLLDKGQVDSASLISQETNNQISGLSAEPTNFFLEQTDISGGDKLDPYRVGTRIGPGESGWACYAHVKPVSTGVHYGLYDIQYIFFYAYNGDLLTGSADSAHEADVEHITVRIEKDINTVHQIYFAAHNNEGKWYSPRATDSSPDGYSITGDGRPIVYSALGSHASYPSAGVKDRGILLPADKTGEGGLEWDCLPNVINLGEKSYPRQGMEWIQYSGRWGEIGAVGYTSGPYGPAYQDWWNSDPE